MSTLLGIAHAAIKNGESEGVKVERRPDGSILVTIDETKVFEDWEEPEINPCRGCTDYDGHGGCKSNGGCAEPTEPDNETGYNPYMGCYDFDC